jgi:hypothetical protein
LSEQEATTATGGIDYVCLGLSDAKGVYDINNRLFCVVLAELVALLRTNQLLENVSPNVCRNFLEV